MQRWLTQTIVDWDAGVEAIRKARYGVIETGGGELAAVHLKALPKLLAWPEFWPVGPNYRARGRADRCFLYYNQPRRSPNYLALRYAVSTRGTTYATIRAALTALDAVADVKAADALLCDASNARLSDRFFRRHGWQSHKPQRWHRNYIKRFYGVYPTQRPPSGHFAALEPVAC